MVADPRRRIPLSPVGLRIRAGSSPLHLAAPPPCQGLADQMSAKSLTTPTPPQGPAPLRASYIPQHHGTHLSWHRGSQVTLQFQLLIRTQHLLSTCCMPGPVLGTWKQVGRNMVPALQTVTTQGNLGFKNNSRIQKRGPLLSLGRPGRPLRRETFELSPTGPVLARRQERRVSRERQRTCSATAPVGCVSSEPCRGLSGWPPGRWGVVSGWDGKGSCELGLRHEGLGEHIGSYSQGGIGWSDLHLGKSHPRPISLGHGGS